jgi:predicted regulator of Ras-like GTPase activity (Roadblock/LC7/MglB family)
MRAAVGEELRDEGSLAEAHGRSLHRVNVGAVDAAQALADLTEISSQIEAAVLFDESGAVKGSTLAAEPAAAELARGAADLLQRAGGFRTEGRVTQLEAATDTGSVFVVSDGPRRIAATTGPQPTVGLVFYDLKSALRNAGAAEEKPKRAPRRKKADAEA